MVKTQIQIPDHLYEETKRVAEDYEMSFAEVVRRSLERTLVSYPPRKSAKWNPIKPFDLGMKIKVDPDEWRLIANEPGYTPRHSTKKRT